MIGKSRLFAGLLALAVTLSATVALAALPPGGTFTDDDGNTFEGAIEAIAAQGITEGCNPPANNRFCPNSPVTRGEMAVFLARAFGYFDDGRGNLFIDDNGLFYESAADKIKSAAVTLGCNPPTYNRYCGQRLVTRGQMAAFLVRALELTHDGGGNFYTDDNHSKFELAIDRIGAAGITRGCNPPINNRFCPDGLVTRGQMAAFLSRALGLSPMTPPPRRSSPPPSGFPNASNTGVPSGTVLTPSGSITVNTPGTVIDARDVYGTIFINANNVTVKRTRVYSTNWWVIQVEEGLTGVVIEDCEIDGGGLAGNEGQFGIVGPVTVRRCDVHDTSDGIVPHTGSLIEGNYVHGLESPGSPHYDGIQIDGGASNIVIRGNTIINDHGQTSAVMIDNYFGPINNISVEGNRLLGGGYTVYSDGQFSGGPITGVSFVSNRMGEGQWGHALIRNNTVTETGNVDDNTGKPIKLDD